MNIEHMDDVCALPLVRRMAATLDLDPSTLRDGDPLPRGWHVCMFNVPTRQSELRPDGSGGLGVTLPDLGLPRLMIAGRRIRFMRDIPIGSAVRRESRQQSVIEKEGRSGRFALVTIRHDVYVAGERSVALEEEQDYVMRPAAGAGGARTTASATAPEPAPRADVTRTFTPTEALLFRYSAITFNPHRIHYDHPYATGREGYPALVVNGGIPSIFLLELFRDAAGREPHSVTMRNVAPLYCGRTVTLGGAHDDAHWHMWARDDEGRLALEATIE